MSQAAVGLFTFRSFRARLLVFLLALLVPVLGLIFYYVNRNNAEYTEQTINSYLRLGAEVFDFTRQQQADTLHAIFSSLTLDFGFRTAYAANDPATLFDAALNVLARSEGSADMMMIVGLDHEIIIDTELQGLDALPPDWRDLLERADASAAGEAETIVTIDGEPFQLIALPLYLPSQVAWIIGGFALDRDFVERVRQTVVSEISIVRQRARQAPELVVSTLVGASQQALIEQLNLRPEAAASMQRIDFAGEEFATLLRSLVGAPGEAVQVWAVIQRSYAENNENVLQFQALLIQFYVLVFAVSVLGVVWLARSISKPLTQLAKMVRRIESGDYASRAELRSRDELGTLADSVNAMASGLAEKEKVRDLLGKVVSQQIAEELLSHPVELGGEEREVTILFADIRGFTSYSEHLPPAQVLDGLNRVLSTISDRIERHNGVVDKYLGDAVMALFGAPVTGPRDADNAMAAALAIMTALEGLEGDLSACVGINTGQVVAGNLGSSNRLNYSVIGDTVNLAARLESLTRLYNVPNIISENSKLQAPAYEYRELDLVRVAGRRNAVRIFELLGPAGSLSPARQREMEAYAEALAAYRTGDWPEAAARFQALLGSCDNTALCQVFLDRIAYFRQNPPASDWQGIFTFDKK